MKLAGGVIQLERGEVVITNRAAEFLQSFEPDSLESGEDVVLVQLKDWVFVGRLRRAISGLNFLLDGFRRVFDSNKVLP